MTDLYEKGEWIPNAKGYDASASLFAGMAYFLGSLGIMLSVFLFVVAIGHFRNGGWVGLLSAATMFFQSIMLIAFGSMMRGLSRVLLAVFEMSVGQTRKQLGEAPPE